MLVLVLNCLVLLGNEDFFNLVELGVLGDELGGFAVLKDCQLTLPN